MLYLLYIIMYWQVGWLIQTSMCIEIVLMCSVWILSKSVREYSYNYTRYPDINFYPWRWAITLSQNIVQKTKRDPNILLQVELEQPMFGANYIKGKVRAQPNGNWVGEAKFKLMFKSGGAIDFGQAMLKAANMGK